MTKWKIEPSFKYDALCFLNIMTSDAFYLTCYKEEYDKFSPMLTNEAIKALSLLSKKIKEDNATIISAWLCLYFSSVDDITLDEMINTLSNSAVLQANFKKTPYYNDDSWKLFISVNSELKIILNWLIEIDFYSYWKNKILPKIYAKITEVELKVHDYDVIKENEYYLGFKLPSDEIIVYMLYYCKPHGIKITGTRFLTSIDWPFEIVIRNAAHEMMHPPYDFHNDNELKNAIESLEKDEFLMNKVLNHNPSFGYNTLEGLIEEDCVQSLEQLINEKLNISVDAKKRWNESDDGIHVFAIALYQVMKEEGYNSGNEIFRDFFVKKINEGKFSSGKIKEYYDKFYNYSLK
jgi:hypothetical protein